jgi:hypothetical protein
MAYCILVKNLVKSLHQTTSAMSRFEGKLAFLPSQSAL